MTDTWCSEPSRATKKAQDFSSGKEKILSAKRGLTGKKYIKSFVLGNDVRVRENAWRREDLQCEFQFLTSTVCVIVLVNQRNEKSYGAVRIQGNNLRRSASLSIEASFHTVEVKLAQQLI